MARRLQVKVCYFLLALFCCLSCPGTARGIEEGPLSPETSADVRSLYFQGDPNSRSIALTFDDGPDDHYTGQILDILRREGVRATFFTVGHMSQEYPRTLRRIIREGHIIGNHSWSHAVLHHLPRASLSREIYRTQWIIEHITGKRPRFIRPPFGAMNANLVHMLSSHGFVVVHWSVDTKDWSGRSADAVFETVRKGAHPGAIILQHSGGGKSHLDGTVEALPRIIRHLKKSGYRLVTLDRLLHLPAYR